jgi:flagellar hook-associated protein 3 FlgL
MITRIADSTRFDTITGNIANLQDGTSRASEQLSTQKKINQPSDDPEGATTTLNLRAAGAAIDQYKENIISGETWLKVTELNLSSIHDLLTQAQGVAQTIGGSIADRTAAAATIQNFSDQMLVLVNGTLDGRYIFSGSKTGAMPFPDSAGAYQGDSRSLLINIGQNSTAVYNLSGDAVFSFTADDESTGNIFQTLDRVVTALRAPYSTDAEIVAADPVTAAALVIQNAAADTEITAALASFQDAGSQVHQQMQDSITKTSAMLNNLGFTDNHLTYLKNRVVSMLSKTEDADTTQLAMELQMHALALNASYTVAAKITEGSILNFLT